MAPVLLDMQATGNVVNEDEDVTIIPVILEFSVIVSTYHHTLGVGVVPMVSQEMELLVMILMNVILLILVIHECDVKIFIQDTGNKI